MSIQAAKMGVLGDLNK